MPKILRWASLRWASAAAIALLVVGCGSGSEPPAATEDDANADAPAASASPEVPAADFDNPLVAGQPPAAPEPAQSDKVDGLIQGSNPDEIAQEAENKLKQNRNQRDPFAIPLALEPKVRVPATENNGAGTGAAPGSGIPLPDEGDRGYGSPATVTDRRIGRFPPALGDPPAPQPAPKPTASTSSGSSTSGSSSAPSSSEQVPIEPAGPPPKPQPTDALAVAVSGVVQVGNTFKVIIQVPGETTPRYVEVGDRIANGQVLVKRVEFDDLLDPIVIFEQYDQEVAKAVGESPMQQPVASADLDTTAEADSAQ
jgi:hypothetical protein